MKAKSLFILLSVLFIIPMNAATLEAQRHRSHWRARDRESKASTRSPLTFDINVQEVDNCLQIIFLSPLPDAEITITDKNGKTIVHEHPTFIKKGKTLYIETPNGYPYTVKIISPIMDITGDIVEEESE